MCGRFTHSNPVRAIADQFGLPAPTDLLTPRYNVAPSLRVPVAVWIAPAARKSRPQPARCSRSSGMKLKSEGVA